MLDRALYVLPVGRQDFGSVNPEISIQGSRLRRPSMLYTRYFRFGREFRLSVRPSVRDFYVCFRSKFRLAVQLGSVDMHRIYIYNTKDKPYILKLNGFERFPSELFTSTIVMRDFI